MIISMGPYIRFFAIDCSNLGFSPQGLNNVHIYPSFKRVKVSVFFYHVYLYLQKRSARIILLLLFEVISYCGCN